VPAPGAGAGPQSDLGGREGDRPRTLGRQQRLERVDVAPSGRRSRVERRDVPSRPVRYWKQTLNRSGDRERADVGRVHAGGGHLVERPSPVSSSPTSPSGSTWKGDPAALAPRSTATWCATMWSLHASRTSRRCAPRLSSRRACARPRGQEHAPPIRRRRPACGTVRPAAGGASASGPPPATTGFASVPIPSISTSTRSPSRSQIGGFRANPTPGGVPVAIRSPGSRSGSG